MTDWVPPIIERAATSGACCDAVAPGPERTLTVTPQGLIVCGGVILASLAIFVDAARTGRTSGVRPPVAAVSGG